MHHIFIRKYKGLCYQSVNPKLAYTSILFSYIRTWQGVLKVMDKVQIGFTLPSPLLRENDGISSFSQCPKMTHVHVQVAKPSSSCSNYDRSKGESRVGGIIDQQSLCNFCICICLTNTMICIVIWIRYQKWVWLILEVWLNRENYVFSNLIFSGNTIFCLEIIILIIVETIIIIFK